MELSQKYEGFRSKYQLPSYKDLNDIFEIEVIEAHSFLLRDIRRQTMEIVRIYLEILEDIIHPNSTVSAFHECKFFDDDKKAVYDIYGRLMSKLRSSNILDLEHDDKRDAAFIKDIYAEWPSIKKDLLFILNRLERCWIQEEMTDKAVSYFG